MTDPQEIVFPKECIAGSLGDAAIALAEGTEVTEEAVFMSLITFLGSAVSGKLLLNTSLFKDTRMYMVILGESGWGRKSATYEKAEKFFVEVEKQMPEKNFSNPTRENLLANVYFQRGVGSAEGLASVLIEHPRTILAYDELKLLMNKAGIDGSALLPAITQLYDRHTWENKVKKTKESVIIDNARLSIIGCCTIDTYENMFSTDALDIGFLNRLFVTTTKRKPKVALPPAPDEEALKLARSMFIAQLMQFTDGPVVYNITPPATALYTTWYNELPQTDQTNRLSNFALRLMPLYALIMDKCDVDEEVVELVCKLLNYEKEVRETYDPIDAENPSAKMENKIIRLLTKFGAMTKRVLYQKANGARSGISIFNTALNNLILHGTVNQKPNGKGSFVVGLADEV